jgi:pimeloyl-ACP methyl ester carboxylesterase
LIESGVRKGYVEGRWGQVHLRRMGAGQPLLLLHQSPVSGSMFEAALPLLAAAGFEAVAVDTAGYGNSDPPPGPVSIGDHGEAVGAVLDALGWNDCHLLGHHTGAAIAAAFAVRQGSRVRRLVLNGVPLLTPEQLAFFRTFDFKPLLPEPDGSHLLAAWNQRLAATPGWTDIKAMHRYVVEMLAINETFHLGFEAALAHDVEPDLRAIEVPTLIFTNSGEDLYDSSCRAAALRPDFAFAALEGGTHDIVDEEPEAWSRAVIRFFRDERMSSQRT